jgi:DnaK suppressor protein
MNTDQYKRKLLAMEQELSTRIARAGADAREQNDGAARDVGDESVSNEATEAQLREADSSSTMLTQVREALQRIEKGTFGKCLVDDEWIGEKRLAAIPWTPYCLKHEQLLEGAAPPRTPTL